MQIIREVETTPRHIYCGCIGHLAPGRKAQFSVAIRTVLVNKRRKLLEYGVGGGIVWDSSAAAEFKECRTKSLVLFDQRPDFSLLETMLWTPRGGFALLDLHLARMAASARYFDIAWHATAARRALDRAAAGLAAAPQRVRLLWSRVGKPAVEAQPLDAPVRPQTLRVRLARAPVDRSSLFLYHKTTHRAVYEAARASAADFDEALLWNKQGEVTEFVTGNVVARIRGKLVTPPVACGLLGGVFRQHLLDRKEVREGILRVEDLARCSALYHINSVRGMRRARLCPR